MKDTTPWTLEDGGNGYCRIVCGRDAEGDLIPVTGDWLPEASAQALVAAHNGVCPRRQCRRPVSPAAAPLVARVGACPCCRQDIGRGEPPLSPAERREVLDYAEARR